MALYIKKWSMADWKELLKWARVGANNAMIGEFTEVEEIPPHGRLIDADALYDEETGEAVFKPKIVSKLVRCKDCIFAQGHFTNAPVKCGCGYGTHGEDFFCADGERRK